MSIESISILVGLGVQILALILAYIKLLVPASKQSKEVLDSLRTINEQMRLELEFNKIEREQHNQIMSDLNYMKTFSVNKSNFCAWANGGSDRLTAKISNETLHLLRPILDEIKSEVKK